MRILLIEDDRKLNEALCCALRKEGYEVDTCLDGEEGLYYMETGTADLVLLDRMLPGLSGAELLRQRRQAGDTTPVLMLTAMGTLEDRITGLDLGADDYLVKPFGMMELVSRVRAVLRRCRPAAEELPPLRWGGLVLDREARSVTADGEPVALTYKEFELLSRFLAKPGGVCTRDQLLSDVWGVDYAGETRTVDVHIRTLRQKLGPYGGCIQTVRQVGYRWAEKPE